MLGLIDIDKITSINGWIETEQRNLIHSIKFTAHHLSPFISCCWFICWSPGVIPRCILGMVGLAKTDRQQTVEMWSKCEYTIPPLRSNSDSSDTKLTTDDHHIRDHMICAAYPASALEVRWPTLGTTYITNRQALFSPKHVIVGKVGQRSLTELASEIWLTASMFLDTKF